MDVSVDPPHVDAVHRLAGVMGRLRTLAAEGAQRMAAAIDLTPGQLAALLAVEDGATSVSDVAHACLSHVSNASRTVDVLVRDGLVDRSRDLGDRRVVLLSLTTHGRTRLSRLHRHRDHFMAAALADFRAEDQDRLVALLGQLVAGMEAVVSGAADQEASPSVPEVTFPAGRAPADDP